MSLLTIGQLSKTTTYIDRWEGAVIKVIAAILNENPSTQYHAKRVALVTIARDSQTELTKIAGNLARYALAENAALAASETGGTDGDIEYVLASLLSIETYLDLLLTI